MTMQSELSETIKSRLGSAVISIEEMKNFDLMIAVRKDQIVSAAGILKNDSELRFTTLMNHLGADYMDSMAVIYNLYSPLWKRKITFKCLLDREQPEIDSLEPVFRGISWYERETFDMLGIRFIGHHNLKRLLLPEDWEGFPLKKDYVYPEEYQGIKTARKDMLE